MTIKERITLALERSNKSQRDLAKLMGLASPTVSAMLSKDEIDSIKYLKAVEELTGYNFEWLRTGEGLDVSNNQSKKEEELSLSYLKDKMQTKDELIEELRGRIIDMKKYIELLEKQLESNKKD